MPLQVLASSLNRGGAGLTKQLDSTKSRNGCRRLQVCMLVGWPAQTFCFRRHGCMPRSASRYLIILMVPMFVLYARLAKRQSSSQTFKGMTSSYRYLPATRDLRRLDAVRPWHVSGDIFCSQLQ